jgi:hypothetical protein
LACRTDEPFFTAPAQEVIVVPSIPTTSQTVTSQDWLAEKAVQNSVEKLRHGEVSLELDVITGLVVMKKYLKENSVLYSRQKSKT